MSTITCDITNMISIDEINYILTKQKPLKKHKSILSNLQCDYRKYNHLMCEYLNKITEQIFSIILTQSLEIDVPFLTLCDEMPNIICSVLMRDKNIYDTKTIDVCATCAIHYRYKVSLINKQFVIDMAAMMQAPYKHLSAYLSSINRLDILSKIGDDCTITKLLKDDTLEISDVINICRYPFNTFVTDIVNNTHMYIFYDV